MQFNASLFRLIRWLVFSYGIYFLLAAICAVFSLTAPIFFTVDNWAQIAIVSCFLFTVAAGLTLVVVTGEIDLSVGSVAYLAGAILYIFRDLPPFWALGLGLLAGLAIGLVNGILVAYFRMSSLLTTLGLMIALRGAALMLTNGSVQSVGPQLADLGKIRILGVVPIEFLVALLVMIVLQVVLSQTKFGTRCYAIGNDAAAASKIGMPVQRVKLAVFVISGITAATAGMLLSIYLTEVTTFTGRGMEFQAAAALVIGGTSLFGGRGNILPGSAVGVLLLTIINNGLSASGVSPYVYPFVAGVVIFFRNLP